MERSRSSSKLWDVLSHDQPKKKKESRRVY
jgi:hypothetical protein